MLINMLVSKYRSDIALAVLKSVTLYNARYKLNIKIFASLILQYTVYCL